MQSVVFERIVELRYSRGVKLLKFDIAPVGEEALPAFCDKGQATPSERSEEEERTSEQVGIFATAPARLNLLDRHRLPVLVHDTAMVPHKLDGFLDDL